MKKLLLVTIIICSSQLLNGQAPFPDKDEIKQFTASKTCVVLEDDSFSSYNVYIKKAMTEFWNITPYEAF